MKQVQQDIFRLRVNTEFTVFSLLTVLHICKCDFRFFFLNRRSFINLTLIIIITFLFLQYEFQNGLTSDRELPYRIEVNL